MEHCTDCEDIIKKMDDDLWFRMDESQKFDRFFWKNAPLREELIKFLKTEYGTLKYWNTT
jgi:hypothetical protein